MSGSLPRVVVTGLGVVAPNGVGLPAFREALQAGRSGIRHVEALEELNFACQIGGIPDLEEEDILRVLPISEYDKLNEVMVYAALAAVECATHAGLDPHLEGDFLARPVDWQTGAVIGCGMGGMDTILEEVAPTLEASTEAEPGRGVTPLGTNRVPQVMGSSVSVSVGRLLGLGGQVTSNSSACCTGSEAIFDGFKHIRLGIADAMYVGGAEGSHPGIWAGFDAMRDVLCSDFNELPERGSRPLSSGACGFVPSAGAGILRLESLEAARARGARILAELVAAAGNSGGQRNGGSMTFPNREGVLRCIRSVVDAAGVAAAQISFINGHLTSTTADPVEVSEWLEALEVEPGSLPWIQATKSMIGHCLGAAGAIESVAVVDQLQQGYIHPSINCEPLHPEIAVISASIPRDTITAPTLQFALKSSFGFGDVNTCLLFKAWAED